MSEPQEVKDIIDGLTTPTADEMYQATREYDTRHVLAAVGAKADDGGGGGGGSSSLSVIGPFTVNWDTPGVNDSRIDLADLAAETAVIRAWGLITEAWVTDALDGFEFSLEAGNAGATENHTCLDYGTSDGSLSPNYEGAGMNPNDGYGLRVVHATGAGWKLRALVYINGSGTLESGSIDFYALINVPA